MMYQLKFQMIINMGAFTYYVICRGGGGGFQKMTLDDGGRGGVYGQMTSSKIAQFRDFLYLKKLFKPNNYAIIYCKQPVF